MAQAEGVAGGEGVHEPGDTPEVVVPVVDGQGEARAFLAEVSRRSEERGVLGAFDVGFYERDGLRDVEVEGGDLDALAGGIFLRKGIRGGGRGT